MFFHASFEKVRDTVRDNAGLATAGACENKYAGFIGIHGGELVLIEFGRVVDFQADVSGLTSDFENFFFFRCLVQGQKG